MKNGVRKSIRFDFGFKNFTKYLNGKNRNFKGENFNIILNVIVNNILKNGVDENGYTEVSSSKFKKEFTGYKIYLDYLIDHLMIERNYYVVGEKSFGYRLTENYKNDIKIKKITDIIINEERKRFNQKISNKTKNVIAKNSAIYTSILNRLKKDYRSCLIDFNPQKRQVEKTYDQWGRFIDIGKWLRNNRILYKWKKGEISFNYTSNRLYSNFTQLSSEVRKSNIKLNGESIVEFDIHNSFPLMLAIHASRINPNIVTDYDFKEYCTNVINATFYQELTKGLNNIRNCCKKGNVNDYSTRLLSKSEVKQLFQIYLNGDSARSPYIHQLRPFINEYMEMKYTPIHELILELKKIENNNVYYSLVAIETAFIFHVIEEIYQLYPDIRILTCHDAIYVPLSYKDRVKIVWEKNMGEFVKHLPCENDLGFNPGLTNTIFGNCDFTIPKTFKDDWEEEDDWEEDDDFWNN